MPKQVDIQADFGAIAEFIGTVQGAAKVIEDDKFMDLVLTRAHAEAAVQFDGDIAVFAAATGTMGHMYEWGTAGINLGRTTRRMDPLAEGAKLWRHKLSGIGGTKQVGFNFKPSVVPIPPPTVRSTGVPRAELNKLKGGPYVFSGKAAIMESGMTVHIRPRGSNMLFLPFGPDGPRNPKYAGLTHIWVKGPITTQPGKTYAGNFSKFWMTWWNTEGERVLSESVQEAVDAKMKNLVDSAGRKMGNRRVKMGARQFKIDVSEARKNAERKMYAEVSRP